MAEADPEMSPSVITIYGSTSACWKGTDKEAAACEKACEKALPACRAKQCTALSTNACVACSEGIDPEASAAMADFVKVIDDVACEWKGQCGTDCCENSSADCRACAFETSEGTRVHGMRGRRGVREGAWPRRSV